MNGVDVFFVCLLCIIAINFLARVFSFSSPDPVIMKRAKTDFDTGRQLINMEIVQILMKYAAENPGMRFGQILSNTGILVDIGVKNPSKPVWESLDLYIDRILIQEEPGITLKRMKKVLAIQDNRGIIVKEIKK